MRVTVVVESSYDFDAAAASQGYSGGYRLTLPLKASADAM
jgi:hypothetical protein